jgi:hypothetical protein
MKTAVVALPVGSRWGVVGCVYYAACRDCRSDKPPIITGLCCYCKDLGGTSMTGEFLHRWNATSRRNPAVHGFDEHAASVTQHTKHREHQRGQHGIHLNAVERQHTPMHETVVSSATAHANGALPMWNAASMSCCTSLSKTIMDTFAQGGVVSRHTYTVVQQPV